MRRAEHRVGAWVLAAACMAAAPAGHAAELHLALDARNTDVSITSSSLIGSVPGRFTELEGALDYDPASQTCRVRLSMPVKSLTLPTLLIRSLVMSEGFLDPEAFPTITVTGTCRPGIAEGRMAPTLAAEMTMRGQTRPVLFHLTYVFDGRTLTGIRSTGRFDRRQWGVGSALGTVEPMIDVGTDIALDGGKPPG